MKTDSNRKEHKQMLRNTIIGVLVIVLALIIAGCSGPASDPAPSGPIKATVIEPQVTDGIVAIPVSAVEDNWNVRFKVETQDGDKNFMAYVLDGEIHVRANVCPPCQSIGFSLDQDILVCDRCATTFEAKTGQGIQGACVDFPKASVPYDIDGASVIMQDVDLVAAYEDTLEPGWP
ncbi:MAG: hypothetical protein A2Z77_08370 [Chloroflexi bacterium RBG_13_51_36]|nr:MAG: hypothetical protein A2Z77_08370 [Chloroflexi bacterium RBG_13_51_36]